MAMGLQDLVMFRDNLQQPEMTGMDNLRNLQALTMQGMASENYMNEQQPMMNTGLMSLPVAQAGFGGFIKKLTSIPRAIVKTVKRVAKSPLGKAAITVAPMFLGLPPVFANPALNAAFYSGTTSLLAGEKPKDALKSAVLSGGLTGLTQGFKTPEGSKGLFSSGQATKAGTGGASSAYTGGPTDTTGLSYGQAYEPVSMVDNVAAQQAAGVGTTQNLGLTNAGVDVAANTYGDVAGTGLAPEFGVTPEQLASPSPAMSSYGGDITTAQYPGGTAPTVSAPSLLDKTKDALMKGVQFAKDKPIPTTLGAVALLSGLGGGQEMQAMSQYTPRQLSDADVGFDQTNAFYFDTITKKPLTISEALARMQTAAQSFGKGGQQQASNVSLGFEDVGDTVLSSSGGLIGMAYGGQMPMNNMDVKYKEFSGMVGGRGDGMEDNVYMPIIERDNGQQVATLAVSPKEYVVDANTMSLLGNGNPDEGAEIMDETVKDIRMAATGQKKQQKEIDGLAALNRMRRSV